MATQTITVCDICAGLEDETVEAVGTIKVDACEDHEGLAGTVTKTNGHRRRKVACEICGEKFLPGTGMAAHMRARHG